jgi:hypothetical protein
MKSAIIGIGILVMMGTMVGCSSGSSDMSTNEVNALKNPSKSGPPPDAANMNIAEKVAAQKKANAAAGVDDQGVPIKK